jgi:hypothetical protein
MNNLTYEKSLEAAKVIKEMNLLALQLDIDYLTKALEEMQENHSRRDSMAVLNPNPFSHFEKQDLYAAKLKQLELMIELSKNTQVIIECEKKLVAAKSNESNLNQLFEV